MKIVVYTHTDYSRAWSMCFGQIHKYYPNTQVVVLVDQNSPLLPSTARVITYNEQDRYADRVYKCLQRLDANEIVLFQHEDMILYDSPDSTLLAEFESLVQQDKAQLIKLIRAGTGRKSSIHPHLFHNPSGMNYCIQPSIAKVKSLLRVYKTQGDTIWQFESNTMANNLLDSYYYYGGEPLRGLAHFDSRAYPYVATAIVKGKWNLQEYQSELNKLFDEYQVDYL